MTRYSFAISPLISRWQRGVTALLFLVSMALCSEAYQTVIIDAGHGGSNQGARVGHVKEKNLTLDVALRVDRILRSKGVRTVMTRTTDRSVSLQSRARLTRRYNSRSTIFVSIHFNAARNRNARGVETFYFSGRGRQLAARVHRYLASGAGTKNRGIKRRGFYVLKYTRCPAILIECGFITNNWERRRATSAEYRQRLANSIAQGILNYRYAARSGRL